MVRSLASWLWLLDFRDRGAALDASDDATGDLWSALAEHFTSVHTLRGDQGAFDALQDANVQQGWTPASATVGTVATASWPPNTFDCIVLYDALMRRGRSLAEVSSELAAWRPLLRRDGWLMLASTTPKGSGRRLSAAGGLSRATLTKTLKRVGYRDVRCSWIEYSLERPLFLIPNSRAAIESYESYDAMRGSGTRRRRLVAKSGFNTLLYPAYFLFARA